MSLPVNSLPDSSEEQQQVIRCLKNGRNVIVDSVAGSGKTTSIFHIALAFPLMRILLLTYNRRLCDETKHKRDELGINNLHILTYHGSQVRFYGEDCHNDRQVRDLVLVPDKPPTTEINYDLVIYDEVQDMTPIYFEIGCKLRRDNIVDNAQLVVFGDQKQCIFAYSGADSRYLSAADWLGRSPARDWSRCSFSTSYRITKPMADVVNHCMLTEERLVAVKPSVNKVHYVIGDSYIAPFLTICRYLERKPGQPVYTPEDIFVLTPSLKNAYSRALENYIKRKTNIPVYVPLNDHDRGGDESARGKIMFSTFHQSKGLERPIVLVLSFDQSYFLFNNRDADQTVCPNELYVAATRAKAHMTLFHHYKFKHLPFLDVAKLSQYASIMNFKYMDPYPPGSKVFAKQCAATDLVQRLTLVNEDIALSYIDVQRLVEPEECIDLETTIDTKYGPEEISGIVGTAIPMYIEFQKTGQIGALTNLIKNRFDEEHRFRPDQTYALANITYDKLTVDQILYIANCDNKMRSHYLFKLFQITSYNWRWLTDELMERCAVRLNELSTTSVFEYGVNATVDGAAIEGSIDCVDGERVYEFKCTKELETSHELQLAVYAYMYMLERPNAPMPTFCLLNLLTNERRQISSTPARLQAMMKHLVKCKYAARPRPLTDAEFMTANQTILDKYWPPALATERRSSRDRSPPRYLEDYVLDLDPIVA